MVYMKWTKQAKLPGPEFASWLHYLHSLPIQKCFKPSPLSTNPTCLHPSSSNKYTRHQLQEGTRSYRWELFIIRPSQTLPPPLPSYLPFTLRKVLLGIHLGPLHLGQVQWFPPSHHVSHCVVTYSLIIILRKRSISILPTVLFPASNA